MNNENANLEVARTYVKACCKADFEKTRSVLHENVYFKSSAGEYRSADSLVEGVEKSISQIANGAEIKREMVVGDKVVISYDFLTKTPVGAIPCTEWFEVKDGKITSVELYFDLRPLMALAQK